MFLIGQDVEWDIVGALLVLGGAVMFRGRREQPGLERAERG